MRAYMRYFLLLLLFSLCSSVHGQEVIPLNDDTSSSGQHFQIDSIVIKGNKRTRREIILRELSIREKQQIRADSIPLLIEQNHQRLLTIGLFTEINISVDTLAPALLRWKIDLKERWYIIPEFTFQLADRNFNVWWTEQNRDIRRTIIGVTLKNKNFRGRLENLGVTVQVGYTKRLAIDYTKPYLDKKQRHGIGFYAGIAESAETFYTTDSNKLRFIRVHDSYILRQYEGALSYSYRPGYASRHIVRLGYKSSRIEDTIAKLNPEYFNNGSKELSMLELAYRLEVNKTDNWNYPLEGTKLIGQLIWRMGLKGMDNQAMALLEAGRYFKIADKWYISSIFRGRLSGPDRQPYALRAALGTKYDYVRGYEYYVIDGSHFGVLRVNLKRELLNTTLKGIPIRYLSSIPIRIYPKIFTDAGYATNHFAGNSFLNNRMLYSAGAGIDIFTAYDIKIRLEYAWNHLDQKGLFLHLSSE